MLGKRILTTVAAAVLCSASGTAAAAAKFDTDVAASIDLGLGWLDSASCYTAPFSCGNSTGLALLALLEKRPSADAAPQGYEGASAPDQARMRRTARHIIDSVHGQDTWYAYRDGAYMMALSVYMNTGGPDKDDGPTTELDGAPLTLKQTLDKVFDRLIAGQLKNKPDVSPPWPAVNGYWCYGTYEDYTECRDSSTTQLVVAGMASARRAYIDGPFKDTVRLAQLDAATELARKAYERNGTVGGACTADPQPANEKGHGYNAGDTNSIQQGASGLWIQLVGGAGLNWPDVQRYLRWQQNRYRWGGIAGTGLDDGWSSSYWYYLWSSFKAYQFLVDSKVEPKTGNIGVADIGTLPEADAPACAVRQVHRDPDTLPRVALFGAGPAGYYGDEEKRIYFDYAYTIMGFQCESGYYGCDNEVEDVPVPGRWDSYAEQAYALLVLQRSVGGGCLDSDRDGICDSEDDDVVEPPVPPSGGLFCDKNLNGRVDESDIRALGDLIQGKRPMSTPVTATNAWANYVRTPAAEALVIDTDDYEACMKVQSGRLQKLYY